MRTSKAARSAFLVLAMAICTLGPALSMGCSNPQEDAKRQQLEQCLKTYTHLEFAVLDSLSASSRYTLTEGMNCTAQKKVLDFLAKAPPGRREELFAQMLDAAK